MGESYYANYLRGWGAKSKDCSWKKVQNGYYLRTYSYNNLNKTKDCLFVNVVTKGLNEIRIKEYYKGTGYQKHHYHAITNWVEFGREHSINKYY